MWFKIIIGYIKKTMCHPNLKVGVCERHLFLGCSEIKPPKSHPLTKVSGLISDIKWKEQYCEREENWKNCKRYQLEEKGIPHENILPNGEKIK